jgi:hypothetical protein
MAERFGLGGSGSNGGGGDSLVDAFEQVESDSRKKQVAFSGVLMEGTGHGRGGAQIFGQGLGHLAQGKPGAAGDDEIAEGEKGAGVAPFRDVAEGVDSDQEEEAVGLFKSLEQAPNRID